MKYGMKDGMALDDLALRLLGSPPQTAHHGDAHPGGGNDPPSPQAVKAAVLVPLLQKPEPAILFTRRTATLARHSGQVSFPGGRCEANDRSPAETALRETMEETGLEPGFVQVAGFLDRYVTGTGFDIQPVVGLVQGGFTLVPNPAEVDEIFEVPLAFLADPANRCRETRMLGGRARDIHFFRYGGHEIWGATAAMLIDLLSRL